MPPLSPPSSGGHVRLSDRGPRPGAAAALAAILLIGWIAGSLRAQDRMIAPPTPSATPAAAKGDLLAVLKEAGKYHTFLKVLDAAGLTSTLAKEGPYTVFAPTDEAFAKLPSGTLDNLLKPESKAKLASILSYHIAPGKVLTANLAKIDELKTLNPESIDVDTMADGKTIEMDDSKIIAPDIAASNGIVQGIDAVLQP